MKRQGLFHLWFFLVVCFSLMCQKTKGEVCREEEKMGIVLLSRHEE